MSPYEAFIEAALWHGPLTAAAAILDGHPDIAKTDIFIAAILGDDVSMNRYLQADPASATTKGGPKQWDPLTYLCFSKYLRLDPSKSEAFVRWQPRFWMPEPPPALASGNPAINRTQSGRVLSTAPLLSPNIRNSRACCWIGARIPTTKRRPTTYRSLTRMTPWLSFSRAENSTRIASPPFCCAKPIGTILTAPG